MGWAYETHGGIPIHELACAVQSELCRAVNERLQAIGLSTNSFSIGRGAALKAFPEPVDFDGLQLIGADSAIGPRLLSNILLIQNFIVNMGPRYFVTDLGGETFYTVESIENAVGLGPFPAPSDITQFRNARLWQRLQGALDLLIYVKQYITTSYGVYKTASRRYGWLPPGSVDMEIAWDNAKTAATLVEYYDSLKVCGWLSQLYFFPPVELRGPVLYKVPMHTSSTPESVVLRISSNWKDMDMPVTYSLNNVEFSTGTGSGVDTTDIEVEPEIDDDGSLLFTLAVETEEPEDLPWSWNESTGPIGDFSTFGVGSKASISFAQSGAAGPLYEGSSMVLDLSPALTDQQ